VTRSVTFWNDEMISLIKENFVAASVPTWLCRTDSPEGEFLRRANIHKQWVTSSGYMNCISAGGSMLGKRPSVEILEKFHNLPVADRQPAASQVPVLKAEQVVIPSPPKGGLVLRVHARFLAREEDGQLRHATPMDFPLMADKPDVQQSWDKFLQPNTEYMWLTRDEWRELVPTNPVHGRRREVDPAIAERMARFHLTPQRATTSEGGIKSRQSVKEARLALVVKEISARHIRMELEGFIHWGSDYDSSKATTPNGPLAQGYETPVHGQLEYDREKGGFTRFDLVAPGDVWGRWGDANGKSMYVERPGRNPFGFALELATGDSPSDRIPPGGNGRYVQNTGYFPDPN
jgi:hypothetical protein